MENDGENMQENSIPVRRKRGPYRQYEQHGGKIPRQTLHNQRKRQESDRASPDMQTFECEDADNISSDELWNAVEEMDIVEDIEPKDDEGDFSDSQVAGEESDGDSITNDANKLTEEVVTNLNANNSDELSDIVSNNSLPYNSNELDQDLSDSVPSIADNDSHCSAYYENYSPLSDDNVARDIDYDSFSDYEEHAMIQEPCEAVEIIEERRKIYEDSILTAEESKMLLITASLTERISDESLQNHINILDCHLPYKLHKSNHLLLKDTGQQKFIRYTYCTKCAVSFEVPVKTKTVNCFRCDTEFNVKKLKASHDLFYYIPLKDQLVDMVRSKLYNDFKKSNDESDVCNGYIYKKLKEKKIIGSNDITIQWNTDGVSLHKSNNTTIYPILVAVNELGYRKRRNNILLCGLWYRGDGAFYSNIFLEPFVKELVQLSKVGIETVTLTHKDPIIIKVHTLFAPIDSVQRPKMQNMHQFNGSFGCSFCLNEGQEIPKGRGYVRVYLNGVGEKRTEKNHNEFVKEAMKINDFYKGVRGPSVTSLIPLFHSIHSYPPEWMHCGVLGVIDFFTSGFFDSKNNEKGWYIKQYLDAVNERLLNIKPCREITKTPIPLNKINFYTANDLMYFGLYYSVPCLKGILPRKYLEHWFLYTYAFYIFSKTKYTESEFQKASEALKLFADDIERLYGQEYKRFNCHLLYHIPLYVKHYGSVWAWSAFPFEHFNGIIKKLFYGTQCIPLQICKQYKRLQFVKANSSIFDNDSCHKDVKCTYKKMMRKIEIKNCIEFDDSLKVFDKGETVSIELVEKYLIERYLGEAIDDEVVKYERFMYNKIMYHSSKYKKMSKRNNSVCLTTGGDIVTISNIVQVKLVAAATEVWIILGEKFEILPEELCKYKNFSSNEICKVTALRDELFCCKVHSLQNKCVLIPYEDAKYIVYPLPNLYERD